MNREELGARIGRVERADSRRHATQLARDLDPYLTMLDAELRTRFVEALDAWGIDTSAVRTASGLGTGESWLLLHAGGREGRVARLVAGARAPSGADGGLPAASLAPVLRALTGVAAKHCRALPIALCEPYVGVAGADRSTDGAITGDSLQLSAAVALLSRALERAPDSSCAGTASVLLDGTLGKVTHLAEKVTALARDFPGVRTVIVAEDQEVPELDVDVTIVPVKTLEAALPQFGLDLLALGGALLDEHLTRARSFDVENRRSRTTTEWQTLSVQAWESCSALAEHDPDESGRCRAWAALFAVHAGDTRLARDLVDGGDESVLEGNPALAVEMHVVRATLAIDADAFEEAATEAGLAVTKSEALDRSQQKHVRGKALGTLGRAHMHAGRLHFAETALREAVAFHRARAKNELAQSLSYLATCLRLARRLHEALAVADEALADNTPRTADLDAARSTQRFLHLERGRILLAMQRYDEAERELLAASERQPVGSYPRLGAERSLVRLRIASGHPDTAHGAYVRCLDAARAHLASGHSPTLARVAAVGVAEGFLALSLLGQEREDAKTLWQKAFDLPATAEAMAQVLARWIF